MHELKLGKMISQRLRHHVFLIRLMLFMLSTRLGTFIFGGGSRNWSPRFPFVLKFSELSLERRQQFVLYLSTSWFLLFRMGFFGIKLLILLAFFSKVPIYFSYFIIYWSLVWYVHISHIIYSLVCYVHNVLLPPAPYESIKE